MRKYAVALVCLVIGCAAGSAMPTITAQTFAPNPAAPRWEQTCVMKGTVPREGREAWMGSLNSGLASRGAEGWELVATPVAVAGSGGRNFSELMLCFKRPVAQ